MKSLIQNILAYVSSDRSYKELLAKCNQLGRGEARSSEKLEKALEKIDKLKVCLLVLHSILLCLVLLYLALIIFIL